MRTKFKKIIKLLYIMNNKTGTSTIFMSRKAKTVLRYIGQASSTRHTLYFG